MNLFRRDIRGTFANEFSSDLDDVLLSESATELLDEKCSCDVLASFLK